MNGVSHDLLQRVVEEAKHNEGVALRWFRAALFTNTIWVLWTVMR